MQFLASGVLGVGGGGGEQYGSLKMGPLAKEVALNLKLQLKLLIYLVHK